jgi:hypothetical protein
MKQVSVHRFKHGQRGASLAEFIVAFPVVIILALLTLQMVLLYRAKLAHNYATEEAVRIGAMSNGRIVPRFVTDPLTTLLATFGYSAASMFGESIIKRVRNPVTGKDEPAGEVLPAKGNQLADAAKGGDGAPPNNTAADSNTPSTANKFLGYLKGSVQSATGISKWTDFFKAVARYGDSSVLQGYMNGIAPMYMEAGDTGSVSDNVDSQARAYMDAMFNSCFLYHNPTQAAFIESGAIELQGMDYGILKIPADYMRFRSPMNPESIVKKDGEDLTLAKFNEPLTGKNMQQKTILTIEVLWSYPLKIPIANAIIVNLVKAFGGLAPTGSGATVAAFNAKALDRGRFPLSSTASYRAQNALHWSVFYPLGTKSPPSELSTFGSVASYGIFAGIIAAWDKILADQNGFDWDPAQPQVNFCLGALDLPGGVGQKNNTPVSTHWWGEDFDKAHGTP